MYLSQNKCIKVTRDAPDTTFSREVFFHVKNGVIGVTRNSTRDTRDTSFLKKNIFYLYKKTVSRVSRVTKNSS